MHARRLRLVRKPARATPKPGLWPRFTGDRVDPMAITYAARAHSVLADMDVREPRGLSRDEAIDVLIWSGQPV